MNYRDHRMKPVASSYSPILQSWFAFLDLVKMFSASAVCVSDQYATQNCPVESKFVHDLCSSMFV